MPLLEASIIGIAPALVLFYWTFESYDRVISDRGLFLSLGAGMVLGFFFALPELWGVLLLDPFLLGPETNTTILFAAAVSVFAIAFWQEGLRGLVLNLPKLRGKWQNAFWGVSLGLGSGAVLMVLTLAKRGFGAVGLVTAVLFAVATVLVHGGLGGLLGMGVSELRAVRGFFIASVGHFGFNALLLAERLSAPLLTDPTLARAAHWTLLGLMVLYGAWLYRHMLRQLPKMLPKDRQTKRRKLLKEARS